MPERARTAFFLILSIASIASLSPAFASSTADFEFLIGEWHLEAIQSPGTDDETKDIGARQCAYVLNKAYIRCDSKVSRSNGASRQVVSLHNYNSVYGHHESLYYFSNWPIKPLARSTISTEEDKVLWVNEFEFEIEKGRTEYIRSEFVYSDDIIENTEYLRTSDEPEDAWRLNYQEVLTRIAD